MSECAARDPNPDPRMRMARVVQGMANPMSQADSVRAVRAARRRPAAIPVVVPIRAVISLSRRIIRRPAGPAIGSGAPCS